jgi:hypothetical protein
MALGGHSGDRDLDGVKYSISRSSPTIALAKGLRVLLHRAAVAFARARGVADQSQAIK